MTTVKSAQLLVYKLAKTIRERSVRGDHGGQSGDLGQHGAARHRQQALQQYNN